MQLIAGPAAVVVTAPAPQPAVEEGAAAAAAAGAPIIAGWASCGSTVHVVLSPAATASGCCCAGGMALPLPSSVVAAAAAQPPPPSSSSPASSAPPPQTAVPDLYLVQSAAALSAAAAALQGILDALSRCLTAVSGGEMHPGITPSVVALVHAAVVWCSPSLALAVPASKGAPRLGDPANGAAFASRFFGSDSSIAVFGCSPCCCSPSGMLRRILVDALVNAVSEDRVRALQNMGATSHALLRDACDRCPTPELRVVWGGLADKAALYRCGGSPVVPLLLPRLATAWFFRSVGNYGEPEMKPAGTVCPVGPEFPAPPAIRPISLTGTLGGNLSALYAVRRGTWSGWGPRPRPLPPLGWYGALLSGGEACVSDSAAAYTPLMQASPVLGRLGPLLLIEALDFLRLLEAAAVPTAHRPSVGTRAHPPNAPPPSSADADAPATYHDLLGLSSSTTSLPSLGLASVPSLSLLGLPSSAAKRPPGGSGRHRAQQRQQQRQLANAPYAEDVFSHLQWILSLAPAPSYQAAHAIAGSAMAVIAQVSAFQRNASVVTATAAYSTAVSGHRLRESYFGVLSAHPVPVSLRSSAQSGFVVGGVQPTLATASGARQQQELLQSAGAWYARRYLAQC